MRRWVWCLVLAAVRVGSSQTAAAVVSQYCAGCHNQKAKIGGIALDPNQRSADGTPGIALEIRLPKEAHDVLEQTRDQIVQLLSRAGFQPQVRVWKVEAAGNSNHYAGTCRMHASPEFGVVDAWSRMHAAANVVVADSSAFTTGPEKNPVLTSMTLSARAADRLASELKSGDL